MKKTENKWVLIKNRKEYKAALIVLESIMEIDPVPNSRLGSFLRFLAGEIEKYEAIKYPSK